MSSRKTVVLVSGGLDSYIAWRMAPEPKTALWVDLGQPYARKELESIERLRVPVERVEIKGYLPYKQDFSEWAIPGRNLLLSIIGATRGNIVWLSALDGEMHKLARERDKTPEFFHLTSGLLTYVFDMSQFETIVETPFRNFTKTGVVKLGLEIGVTAEEMKQTSSCYHGELRNCGLCGTCFKRWIAMVNNGIEEEYLSPPWKNDYAIRTIDEMIAAEAKGDYRYYSRSRIRDTMKALERVCKDRK